MTSENTPDLSRFNIHFEYDVRFSDLDAMGHVNNARFLTYMETARVDYFLEVLDWSGKVADFNLILARAEIDYRAPLHFPGRFSIYMGVTRIGSKSFDIEYLLIDSAGVLCAEARTVQVAFDFQGGQTMLIPDEWRSRFRAFEGMQRTG